MEKDWVIEEFLNLELGDQRLEERSRRLMRQLSGNPTDSIPTACASWSDLKAAYRLFANPKVEAKHFQSCHKASALCRMAKEKVVLLPQDTTVLNFTKQHARSDTGPTVRNNTKGMLLHTSIALTSSGVCLGVMSSNQWHREKLQGLNRLEKQRKNYATPINEKERYRWL